MAPIGIVLRAMLAAAGLAAGEGRVVATDDFTNSDLVLLTNHNANWIALLGNFAIYDNQAFPRYNVGEQCVAWLGEEFDPDQYSQAVISTFTSGLVGVACRAYIESDQKYYYGFYTDGTDSYLFKILDGPYTELVYAEAVGFSVSDVIRIEAEGTAIRGLKNGEVVASVSDNSIATGHAGVAGWNYSINSRIDDWEGGNL